MDFCLSYFGVICKTKTKFWTQGRVPGTVSYVLHDDILTNEGPHIQQWTHGAEKSL